MSPRPSTKIPYTHEEEQLLLSLRTSLEYASWKEITVLYNSFILDPSRHRSTAGLTNKYHYLKQRLSDTILQPSPSDGESDSQSQPTLEEAVQSTIDYICAIVDGKEATFSDHSCHRTEEILKN